jgi:AbiJ N-terminal domain 4
LAIIDLFSKRQKKLRGEVPDVYVYSEIPQQLKVQVLYIWRDALGDAQDYQSYRNYMIIVEQLCREYGCIRLPGTKNRPERHYLAELTDFLSQEQDTEKVMDVIELSFQRVFERYSFSQEPIPPIEELNTRFREHGAGYQFVGGQIIRVDSELIHAEVIRPALALLHGKEFAGAQDEFFKAHEHYRHGNSKEALAECLKAFESVMKVICTKRKWAHAPHATCSTLIQVCFDNGLIPSFWQSQFSALRSLLEGGVPTARNRLGGHGQGGAVVEVPDYLVAYVLHMTAASIVFLVEADRQLK